MQLVGREYNPHTGVTTEMRLDGGRIVVEQRADVTEMIEANKRMANANSGKRYGDGLMHEVARIPNLIAFKWLREDGLDIYSNEPNMRRKLFRKLNDPEWKYLKTTDKRIILK